MASDSELRARAHVLAVREIFGAEWRAERPLENIGGMLNAALSPTMTSEWRIQKLAEINGTIKTLSLMNQAAQELNQGNKR